jgi:hypothetical protein
VVEEARLESVYIGNGIAGSNPALSAEKSSGIGFFNVFEFLRLFKLQVEIFTAQTSSIKSPFK